MAIGIIDYGMGISQSVGSAFDRLGVSHEIFTSLGHRSQCLKPAFQDVGQDYWASLESWLQQDIRYNQIGLPVPVSQKTVCDIGSFDDWFCVETIYHYLFRLPS